MTSKTYRNPFLIFLPFLLYYVYHIVKHRYPELYGDEGRYISFAHNLLHGFYSPPAPDLNLWNGPGYPIFIALLKMLHVPDLRLSLSNAVLLYLSVVFLYQSLRLFVRERIALLFSLLWALNPNMIEISLSVYTEVFTAFLVSAIIYTISLHYITGKKHFLIITGLLIGVLALTKVLIGYVLLIGLLAGIGLLLFKKLRPRGLNTIYIFLTALVVTAPYLIYTHHLTGKVFYWGNAGGMSLYWMSTPFNDEYGDWKEDNLKNSQFPLQFGSAEGDLLLRNNHEAEIKHIIQFKGVARDSAYKAAAIKNIKQNPRKFLRNYYFNFSRMLFGFPYSYSYQESNGITDILTGSLLFWAVVAATIISLIHYRKLIYPVVYCLVFTVVYLALSGVVSAYPRMLDVAVPMLLFWIAYVCDKLVISRLQIKPVSAD